LPLDSGDFFMADIPEYASKPLQSFLSYQQECSRLFECSMRGMSLLLDTPDPEATFVKQECLNDFPLLHAHTLVGCWGAFEAAMEDLGIGLLMNEPRWLQNEAFPKLKIPLAEFEILEKDERMRLLIQELQRSQYKRGTASFEHVLNQFQLSGKVDPRIKQTIWEMLNVRNVIIHRGSVADRRVERCPWMELQIGQPVVVTHSMLASYADALSWYVRLLIEQLSERYRDATLQDRLSPTSEEQGSLDSRTEVQAAQIR
jgi:hypothetical protein